MNKHEYRLENLLSILSENNFVYSVNDSFEYADVQGYAYYIGSFITLFKKNNSNFLSAISIEETSNEQLFEILNMVLDYIGFPILIGDNLDKVYTILGKPYHTNTIMYDDRLLYLISEDYWVSIGVSKEKVLSIEILFDCEIINNVREIMDES